MAGEQRDRLTSNMFLNAGSSEPVTRFEDAFRAVWAAAPARVKLHKALKQKQIKNNLSLDVILQEAKAQNILTTEEIELVRKAEEARQFVIRVDEFDPVLLEK